MTYEKHMFLSKYLFNKTVEVKKKITQPLDLNELRPYESIDNKGRLFYEALSFELIRGLKIDFKNHPPF